MTSSTRTGSRGPYRAGVQRREQIVATAMSLFGELGFAGASLRTIADGAGVSHASLLQHFGSKEGLLTAVLQEWDRRTVEARLTDAEGLEYFHRLPGVMAAHLTDRGLLELFTTIAAEASSPSHPAHDFIRSRYTANLDTLAGHLQHAVDVGDVRALTPPEIDTEVRLVTAVLDGVGLQWLLNPDIDVARIVESYVAQAMRSWQTDDFQSPARGRGSTSPAR